MTGTILQDGLLKRGVPYILRDAFTTELAAGWKSVV